MFGRPPATIRWESQDPATDEWTPYSPQLCALLDACYALSPLGLCHLALPADPAKPHRSDGSRLAFGVVGKVPPPTGKWSCRNSSQNGVLGTRRPNAS